MNTMTLLELNSLVKKAVKYSLPESYWIQAEISEIKEHYSGHCYLELIQKKADKDVICARSRATIWANTWSELGAFFENKTGSRLKAGHKVLVEVTVDFHELYGMSLVIRDIDPTYTLGDQAARRLEILKKLESDGVIDQNKELEIPPIPSKIAIVSSPAAAGFQDFLHQIENNEYGFKIYTNIFPAIMQGETAPQSIIDALENIDNSGVDFDLIVIIRGGGASADLTCFDDYNLCYYCTQYPKPILTGLGHERDFSVLDRVANTSVKTPTAAAEFILGLFLQQAFVMDEAINRLIKSAISGLDSAKLKLHTFPGRLSSLTQQKLRSEMVINERYFSLLKSQGKNTIVNKTQYLEHSLSRLKSRIENTMKVSKYKIEMSENLLNLYSPQRMLERGFAMTVLNGKIIKSVKELNEGDTIETRLKDGVIESSINKLKNQP